MIKRGMQEDKELMQECTERLVQRFGDWVRKVIFFGSRAKGLPKPGSDYDLLLVAQERDRDLIDQVYEEALEFLLQYGVEISLKIYDEKAFQKGIASGIPFFMSVKETGDHGRESQGSCGLQSGRIGRRFGHILGRLKDERETGDYDMFSAFEREDARKAIEEAEVFLQEMWRYLTEAHSIQL